MGKLTQQNAVLPVNDNIINIFAYKSDNFNVSIEVNDLVDGELTPFDFSGYTALMKVKRRRGDEDAFTVIAFDTSDGSIILDTGTITLVKDSDAFDSIRVGKYVYDIELTKTADSSVQSIISGSFIVEQDITT